MLELINTPDGDLDRVQQNVKKETDALASALPSKTARAIAVTADYAAKLTDAIVLANPVTVCSVTLPPAAAAKGLRFTVKNTSTAGTVYVRGYQAGAVDLIDGAARRPLTPGAWATCYSDGIAWWVL